MLNETSEKLNNQAIILALHGDYTEAIHALCMPSR